jgi:threonine/homoserine/homoserine lactone efflux protein
MDFSFFIKGLVFGFSIAAPVGPIGILCIRRSLASGWRAGLLTGMGAATADALYGCVAGFGLASITGMVMGQRVWIQTCGGLFLCGLGLRIFLSGTDQKPVADLPSSAAMGYLSALFLTLTNPMTILSFTAVFAGMGLGGIATGHAAAGWLVAGVFFGSMTWWIILSSVSSLFNARLNAEAMRWTNRISGAVLAGFGLAAVVGRL